MDKGKKDNALAITFLLLFFGAVWGAYYFYNEINGLKNEIKEIKEKIVVEETTKNLPEKEIEEVKEKFILAKEKLAVANSIISWSGWILAIFLSVIGIFTFIVGYIGYDRVKAWIQESVEQTTKDHLGDIWGQSDTNAAFLAYSQKRLIDAIRLSKRALKRGIKDKYFEAVAKSNCAYYLAESIKMGRGGDPEEAIEFAIFGKNFYKEYPEDEEYYFMFLNYAFVILSLAIKSKEEVEKIKEELLELRSRVNITNEEVDEIDEYLNLIKEEYPDLLPGAI